MRRSISKALCGAAHSSLFRPWHALLMGTRLAGRWRARVGVANVPACAVLPGSDADDDDENVLVPIDISPCSDAALEHALAIDESSSASSPAKIDAA